MATYSNNIRSVERISDRAVTVRYDLVGDDGAGHTFAVARALDAPYAPPISTLTTQALASLIVAADTDEAARKQAAADAVTASQKAAVDTANAAGAGADGFTPAPYPPAVAPDPAWVVAQKAIIDRELAKLAQAPAVVDFSGTAPTPSPPLPLSPADQIAALKAYTAAKRYAVETGGTSLNGMRVYTDRGTQNAIDRTLNAIEKGIASVPVGWKGAEGWIDLDAAALTAIGAAVAKHVQAAFAAERSVSDAIDKGAITSTAQIDAAAWPSNG